MKEGQKYAVWLTDEAARAFLGIDAKQPQSRWVVLGECTGEESGVGFWVHVDHIEQWMAVGDSRTITVSPPAGLPHPMELRDYDPRAERVQGPEGHGLQEELSVRTRPRSPGYGALSRARAPVVRWPGRAGTLGHSPARSSVSRPAALGASRDQRLVSVAET